ncbi:MAG: leucine-rich repeat domain-containing protein [Bacteroidales bacterium]|nr:leucine-rich repeat domain-containing protein [Bacteroidales bacterium]
MRKVLLISLFVLLAAVQAKADWSLSVDSTLTITSDYNYDSRNSYPWYSKRSSVKKVVFSDGAKIVGKHAFELYTNIKSVTFGKDVTTIDEQAFYGCRDLTSITIPKNVTSLGSNAFSGCENIATVVLEDGYAGLTIGDDNFDDTPIKTLHLGRTVTYNANKSPFHDNANIKNLEIAKTVTRLSSSLFNGCTGITEVTIPSSVTQIDASAFANCSNLKTVKFADGRATLEFAANTVFSKAPIETLYIGRNLSYKSTSDAGYSPFNDNTSIKTAVLSDSVTTINDYLFNGCSKLSGVTIGKNVTSIGADAFFDCGGLTCITIPNSVTEIKSDAFAACKSIKTVVFEDGKAEIVFSNGSFDSSPIETLHLGRVLTLYTGNDYSPFYGKKTLTNLEIAETVTRFGRSMFEGCTGLTDVTIPKNLWKFGPESFENCTGLTSITIPSSVTSICERTFAGCKNLKTIKFEDGNAALSLEDNVFKGCSIDSLYLGRDLSYNNSSSSSPFYHMDRLRGLTISDSVTTIGPYAFAHCSSLKSITIPSSVTLISHSALSYCSNLKTVEFEDGGSAMKIDNNKVFEGSPIEKLILGRNLSYENSQEGFISPFFEIMTITEAVITSSVKTISKGLLCGCTKLTNLTISSGVTNIGEKAFCRCSALTNISIPNSVTNIDANAFGDCTELSSVTFEDGKSTLSLDLGAFTECPIKTLYLGRNLSYAYSTTRSPFNWSIDLTKVTISDSVTTIPDYAFSDCAYLEKLTISDNVKKIGSHAFEGCSGLKSVKLPKSLEYIDSYAFNRCLFLDITTIPNGVETISNNAFSYCTEISKITIPNSVTSIYSEAFIGCSKLKYVTLNDGNKSMYISSNAFSECPINGLYLGRNLFQYYRSPFREKSTLERVVVSDSVRSFVRAQFKGCKNLAEVANHNTSSSEGHLIIPNTIESIYDSAFYGCSKLEYLTIAAGNETLKIDGNNAFAGGNLLSVELGRTLHGGYSYNEYTVFKNITSLTTVTVTKEVEKIPNNTFKGCTSLESLEIEEGDSTLTLGNNVFGDCPIKYFRLGRNLSYLYYNDSPCYAKGSLRRASIFGKTSIINGGMFENCVNMDYVELSKTIKKIGNYAFEGCSNIGHLSIPDSVETIGVNAFDGCQFPWNQITIPGSVKSIGYNAFANTKATSIKLEEGDDELTWGNNVFQNDTISSVYLGRNMNYDDSPFRDMKSLKQLKVYSNVTHIAPGAFEGCSALESISVDAENTTYDSRNYSGTIVETATNTVILGSSYATIGNSVTGIGEKAFCGRDSLKSIVIPSSVKSIGKEAFSSCDSLKSVTICNNVENINDSAFYNCQVENINIVGVVGQEKFFIPKIRQKNGVVISFKTEDGLVLDTVKARFVTTHISTEIIDGKYYSHSHDSNDYVNITSEIVDDKYVYRNALQNRVDWLAVKYTDAASKAKLECSTGLGTTEIISTTRDTMIISAQPDEKHKIGGIYVDGKQVVDEFGNAISDAVKINDDGTITIGGVTTTTKVDVRFEEIVEVIDIASFARLNYDERLGVAGVLSTSADTMTIAVIPTKGQRVYSIYVNGIQVVNEEGVSTSESAQVNNDGTIKLSGMSDESSVEVRFRNVTPVVNIKENNDVAIAGIYTLSGMRIGNSTDNLPRGIYIIVYTDGSSTKVLVK